MMKFLNKCKGPVLMLILALVIGLTLGGVTFDDVASAGLKKSKRVGFMGWQYSDNLGNTTGNTDNVLVEQPNVPDEYNCVFSVTNSTGALVANTSTVEIRTSYDNVLFDVVKTVTVAASTVTGIRNTPGATRPFGNYWDMNITAIQNANDSRVNAQCVFE